MNRVVLFALALTMSPGRALAEPAAPLLMDPTYSERAEVTRVEGCEITIAELTDGRRAPETFGIIAGFRSIAAPTDRQAWLRSVIEVGLRARGFTPTFALVSEEAPAPGSATEAVAIEAALAEPTLTEPALPASAEPAAVPGPEVLTIRVRLHSIWLASLGMNKTGSAVWHVSAAHGAQSHDGYYRGEYVATNWNSGRGEFNEHLDRTIAEALNAMASDLATMCGGAN
jgi:hypothetical protein